MEHPRDYESPLRAVSERATDTALLNADECSGELAPRLAPLANPDDNNRRDRWSTTASNRPPVWIGLVGSKIGSNWPGGVATFIFQSQCWKVSSDSWIVVWIVDN